MNLRDSFRILLLVAAFAGALAGKECIGSGSVTSKLFCYYSDARRVDVCKCSHVILPETTPVEQLKELVDSKGAKVLLTVREFNQNLLKTLNATKIFGLEVQLKKLSSKQDITDFISTVRTKLGADLYVALSVPAKPEILAKYYDFKTLSKHADVFTLQTHFLGANRNVTFHPSRLSGLWDVQNTDSVVDLVTGLGAPLGKLVVATPVQGFKFLLQNEEHTAPGSPALELSTLTRDELCITMESDKWTLERDQDQAGPYIFRKNKWIAFEDAISMDIKAKYARVRGLAGLALKDLSQDGGSKCGETLLESAFSGLTKQARAPRGAVLHSLEREILEPAARPFDNVQVSPYRISRVIDTEGHVHAIRQDTRTEFKCSRQGYFVHPRSCNRFYRCVKFDQQSDEFSVFEFDCPAGLAFDERVEVCVWPGSLPDGAACAGSSEIAPVPRERFVCPDTPGYYADPENCRWFFACMDHGKSPLTAYEFRCPYGLVFDQDNLLCEWSWLVPKCGSGVAIHETVYGGYAAAGSVSGVSVGAGLGIGAIGGVAHGSGAGSADLSLEGRGGAFELDLYDGLGSLNSIQLGGLSGPLHPTEAITYSNVEHSGTANEEYQLLDDKVPTQAVHAYAHDLSAGSQVSLNDAGYYQSGSYDGSNGQSGHYQGENIAAADVASTATAAGVQTSDTYTENINHQGDALKYYNAFAANRFAENAAGFEYDQGHQLHQPAQHSINIVAGGSSGVASYAKNVDILQHGVKIDVESIKPGTLVSSTTISPIPTVTSVPLPSTAQFDTYNNFGVVANLPNLQYKLENPTIINHQLHQLDGINPQKTYYSASNVSVDYAGYASSNANTFKQFNGYHYEKPIVPFVEGQNHGFVSYEAQTYNKPQVMINEHDHYKQYNQNQVVYEQNPLRPEVMKTYTYEQSYGYNYEKPKVAFAEGANLKPATTYQQVHVQQPSIAYQQVKHEAEIKHEGYVYNKPAVSFVEGAVEHSGYHYEKPSIKFEAAPVKAVTPALTYKQVALQPATTYSEIKIQPSVQTYHNIQHAYVHPANTYQHVTHEVKNEGYHYEKPAIKFDEKPIVPVTTYHEVKPQPTVSYQQVNHEVKHEGYHYEKPAIKFEEKPVVPATTYQHINVQPAVTYHQVNHEVKHEGYHYVKPTIKFEEKPVVPATTYQEINIQPAVTYQEVKHEGYHYEKPAIKFEKPVVPVTTYLPQEVKVQPAVTYQQVNHEVKHEGYHYEKPTIKFEEKPIVPATTYQEIKIQPAVTYQEVKHEGYHYEKPIVPATTYQEVKPAVTYQQVNHEVKHEGYHYEQPAIKFEEKPVVPATTYLPQEVKVQPAVTYQQVNHEVKHEGYHYEKPAIKFEEKPVVPATTYQLINFQPAVAYQEVKVQQPAVQIQHEVKHQGYHYEKPAVAFEEKPATTYQQINIQPVQSYQEIKHETPKVLIAEKTAPGVQEIKHEGYHYEKPAIRFEETPVVPATTYQEINIKPAVTYETKHEGYHYEKPKVVFEENPVAKPTYLPPVQTYQHVDVVKPAVTFTQHVQPALPSYSYQKPIVDQNIQTQSYHEIHHKPAVTYQEVKHEGYHYEKPKVVFEEKPATTYQEINIQPAVKYEYQTPKPAVAYHETKHEGYVYEKPKIAFIEEPAPVVPPVPTVSYVHHVQPQPTPILSTYHEVKPLLVEQKPTYKQVIQAVTPKPVITNSFSINQYSQGYHYNKPAIVFEEKPVVKVVPTAPAYLPPKQVKINPALNYIPPRPAKAYIPAPTTPAPPVKEYLPQLPVQTYLPAPAPTVKTVKPVQTHYQEYYDAKEIVEQPLVKTKAYQTGYHYEKPAIKFEYSTPKPTYVSTVSSIIAQAEPQPLQFFSYDSRLDHPKVQQKIEKIETVHVQQPVVPVVPIVPVVPVVPVVQEVKTVTSKPIVRYEFSSLDYQPVQPIVKEKLLIHVPEREYLPVTTTRRPVIVAQKNEYLPPTPPKRVYLPVTTTTEKYVEVTSPSREYLPVTEVYKIRTSTPAREYLPATRKVRTRPTTTTAAPTTTTKLSREYLPVESTKPPSREYLPVKSTTPSREYLPVFSTSKPNREYLPAKQVENYEYKPEDEIVLSTRRPKVIKVVKSRPIVKVNDFHPILSAKLGAQCTCTSNTLTLRRRKPQKSLKIQNDADDATTRISDEEEYVTNEDQLDTRYDQVPKKQSVIIVAEEDEDISQDDEIRRQDIAKAVDSGLKLVKSAVKQGVKEGVQEALSSKDFDRYGPGGVRGRSETLQGTVDCQRAGLFRHPKHCNKFYACRWDEGKKKFTLHVFNCPVHLTFDNNLGACNWPSQGPACVDNTLLPSD